MGVIEDSKEIDAIAPGRGFTTAFVVLHYLSASLTIDCVNSILDLQEPGRCGVGIVIVDNASNNGSLEAVVEAFGEAPNISFIANSENLGFSRANDLGYERAVELFSPKFVAVINNDTEIRDRSFIAVLDRVYGETGAHVIGPDIYVERKGFHQNPAMPELPSREHFEGMLERNIASERLETEGGLSVAKLKRMTRLRVRPIRRYFDRKALERRCAFEGWKEPAVGCVLHGAALVFTEKFIATGELPFDPPTFLYEEECILALRCAQNGWKMVYTPELQVIHFDDGSTDIAYKDYVCKRNFLRRNEIDSLGVLLALYSGDDA